jgi:hypothetical protein
MRMTELMNKLAPFGVGVPLGGKVQKEPKELMLESKK